MYKVYSLLVTIDYYCPVAENVVVEDDDADFPSDADSEDQDEAQGDQDDEDEDEGVVEVNR